MFSLFSGWRKKYINFSVCDHLHRKLNPKVIDTDYPYFCFPDLYFAIDKIFGPRASRRVFASVPYGLAGIINTRGIDVNLKVGVSSTHPWPIAWKKEKFYSTDTIWFCSEEYEGKSVSFVVRLKLSYTQSSSLEVVSTNDAHAEAVVNRIKEHAMENSIYRGSQIEIAYTEAVRDIYGEQESGEKIELKFKNDVEIKEEEIILEDHIKKLIKELIFDFEDVKNLLGDYNIKKKRGVIFHGPPGTGKTYTTKYISGRLKDRTVLICCGKILSQIKVIANIAKMLSPAVVVLEDIDLVFSQREMNYDQNNLSEFMDILDGHADEQDILFILNTNSLSRVEEAIKDRPGRITQCVFMGAPSTDLREKYFRSLLKCHNATMGEMSRLVDATEGCTQAFIKELIVRSIQKQLNVSGKTDGEVIHLDELLCLEVLDQIKTSGENSEKILGFSVSEM